ncbi:hypothetical protein KFK09_024888 [Dendrobium nobile]|uniref:Uncharacterized protein n=1 Tax=Dendrobium nobile TaxID=94219 RepID=A0A8T3AKH3_DENNO|nr:hypothetical protein KFK09_024888 [Dendrobium nobile]
MVFLALVKTIGEGWRHMSFIQFTDNSITKKLLPPRTLASMVIMFIFNAHNSQFLYVDGKSYGKGICQIVNELKTLAPVFQRIPILISKGSKKRAYMVELKGSCPCCGHKRRRPVLDRLKSCPVSFTVDAIPRPAKFTRSSSLPSHSCVAAVREDPRLNAAAGHSPAMSSLVLRPATSFPITLKDTPVPDKKEEEKAWFPLIPVGTDNHKNDKRKVKIWGGESVKITIKCKCGSVQKVEFLIYDGDDASGECLAGRVDDWALGFLEALKCMSDL